jgi:ATP adenylyltransferase
LLDKAKAKVEALAAARSSDNSPDPKRQKRETEGGTVDKQNSAEPFKPPYVPELFLGCLEGLEDEGGMSILVSTPPACKDYRLTCSSTKHVSD